LHDVLHDPEGGGMVTETRMDESDIPISDQDRKAKETEKNSTKPSNYKRKDARNLKNNRAVWLNKEVTLERWKREKKDLAERQQREAKAKEERKKKEEKKAQRKKKKEEKERLNKAKKNWPKSRLKTLATVPRESDEWVISASHGKKG
jgi:hypothetical protein